MKTVHGIDEKEGDGMGGREEEEVKDDV